MAVTRLSNSGIKTGILKYDSTLAGYPGVMPAPTAADGGTGTTATVSFSAVTGATSYTAISTPGSFTGSGTASPVTVSGLTTGTPYTFQIRANNAAGSGAYSAASNSITPLAPGDFDSIATVSGTGSSNTVTFSNIPQTYRALQIRFAARDTSGNGSSGQEMRIRFNGDTSSIYNNHQIIGQNGAISLGSDSNQAYTAFYNVVPGGGSTANIFGVGIIDLYDYATTSRRKTLRCFAGVDNNGGGYVTVGSGSWMSTSAVTSITLYLPVNSFTSDTRFALYGKTGA